MIRILKIDGAMLCHIRPQYLLAFNDYHAYIKSLPAEELQFVHPNSLRMTPSRFQYFHVDSWCTLFYQILRVYYLSRINIKILKTIPNVAYAASQQAQQVENRQLILLFYKFTNFHWLGWQTAQLHAFFLTYLLFSFLLNLPTYPQLLNKFFPKYLHNSQHNSSCRTRHYQMPITLVRTSMGSWRVCCFGGWS